MNSTKFMNFPGSGNAGLGSGNAGWGAVLAGEGPSEGPVICLNSFHPQWYVWILFISVIAGSSNEGVTISTVFILHPHGWWIHCPVREAAWIAWRRSRSSTRTSQAWGTSQAAGASHSCDILLGWGPCFRPWMKINYFNKLTCKHPTKNPGLVWSKPFIYWIVILHIRVFWNGVLHVFLVVPPGWLGGTPGISKYACPIVL